jgi:leucyl aminopeptidase
MIIEYFNTTQSSKIALIGKGIMMDTGGYELKPSKFMQGMNQDMTGASVVFGIIHALASTNAKVNVIGVIPLAKNLINSKAMFVNDIYKACNGMSVEILSQDSEGRLILADALAYVNKKYKISKAITIATLTGLSAISFGDFLTPF